MNDLKDSILKDAKKGGGNTTNTGNETTYASNETTSAINTATTPATTTRSNDTYVYSDAIIAVLAIGVCVSFTFQAKNKKQDQSPQRIHVFKKPK